jgi:hypothetical protein
MDEEILDIPVHHRHHQMLPVWFFIGVLLFVYGVIILWVGLSDYNHPAQVVLADEHANVWGGVILILLGGSYAIKFWPRRSRR